jgi:hypothetical protein
MEQVDRQPPAAWHTQAPRSLDAIFVDIADVVVRHDPPLPAMPRV